MPIQRTCWICSVDEATFFVARPRMLDPCQYCRGLGYVEAGDFTAFGIEPILFFDELCTQCVPICDSCHANLLRKK